jgi:hypothetical protein
MLLRQVSGAVVRHAAQFPIASWLDTREYKFHKAWPCSPPHAAHLHQDSAHTVRSDQSIRGRPFEAGEHLPEICIADAARLQDYRFFPTANEPPNDCYGGRSGLSVI